MKPSNSKSILLIVILFLTLSNSLVANNFNITFSAYGARNNFDSIVVENITQNLSVKVPAGSTLNLINVTAVDDLYSDKSLTVYPNPIDKIARVSFFSEQRGNTQFSVYGVDGKCIVRFAKVLDAGINQFQISLPKGVFSLVINENGIINTAKIISNSNTKTEFEFTGNEKDENVILQKNKTAEIKLKYNPGDILLMKAYAGNFVSILSDIITEDKNIYFNIVECLDQEGINYPVVTIGSQVWMADNLKTSRYRNNVTIPDKTNDVTWGTIFNAAYSDYNSPITSTTYGKLYNWFAVTNSNNLAPLGWHIPSDDDWTTLSNYLGGASVAGSKLKQAGNTHWLNANSDATNSTGFNALPGGSRSTDGNIYDFSNVGYWWSTTKGSNVNSAFYRYLTNTTGTLNNAFYNIKAGMSVRCVMGDLPIVSTTSISSISASGFISGGNITFDGNLPIISRGVCWSTNQNPTINDSKTSDDAGVGEFTSTISGLNSEATYYVCAYATNSYGTAYGAIHTVSTALPTITTASVTFISTTSVMCGGTVSLVTGAADVTSCGVCWSLNQNPTIDDNKTIDVLGMGSFNSSIYGLTADTIYYIRAYVINSVGIAYGEQKSFSTGYTGDGTKIKPYTVTDVIMLNPTNSINAVKNGVWTKGYIVGYHYSTANSVIIETVAPFTDDVNVMLAARANETDKSKMISIQLPAGPVRSALGLKTTPANFGKEIMIYGDILLYNLFPGVKFSSGCWFVGTNIGFDPPTEGDFGVPEMSIAELRTQWTGTRKTITDKKKIVGVVISDIVGDNNGSLKNLTISSSDNSAGIIVRLIENNTYNLGDKIEISLEGLELNEYGFAIQLNNVPTIKTRKIATDVVITPKVTTISDIRANYATYESTLVTVTGTITSPNGLWGSSTENQNNTLTYDAETLILYVSRYAFFIYHAVPTGLKSVTGIVSQFSVASNNAYQLKIRNLNDIN